MGSEVNGILVAAHELKAPLSLMRQLALSLQIADDAAIQDRLCSQMVDVSERALRQVNDLAKIARLEDGLFNMEPVSVRGVCESVLQDVRPLFRYQQKTLRICYRNRQKLAVAHPELLYSIIHNFCSNAMHYSSPETTSVLTVSDVQDIIKIDVRDYGPALPAQIWRQLNHGQLDRPTSISMRPGSSGLGLYIATQFARHMHAEIGATRHRDGTSFFVNLPISQQACLFG